MTEAELLAAVKISMGLSGTAIDAKISMHIAAVKGYLLNGGVSEEQQETDAGIQLIAMGVTDIGNVKAGETKFSPVFYSLVTQLAGASLE